MRFSVLLVGRQPLGAAHFADRGDHSLAPLTELVFHCPTNMPMWQGHRATRQRRHYMRDLAERRIDEHGVVHSDAGAHAPRRRSVTVNLAESPLSWLASRGLVSARQVDRKSTRLNSSH